MEKLDRRMQQRVWARVYGGRPVALTDRQRQELSKALHRCRKNLEVFESMTGHAIYAEAFNRLSRETQEQIKMLQQISGQ